MRFHQMLGMSSRQHHDNPRVNSSLLNVLHIPPMTTSSPSESASTSTSSLFQKVIDQIGRSCEYSTASFMYRTTDSSSYRNHIARRPAHTKAAQRQDIQTRLAPSIASSDRRRPSPRRLRNFQLFQQLVECLRSSADQSTPVKSNISGPLPSTATPVQRVCPPNCTITPPAPLKFRADNCPYIFKCQWPRNRAGRWCLVGRDRFRITVDHDRLEPSSCSANDAGSSSSQTQFPALCG